MKIKINDKTGVESIAESYRNDIEVKDKEIKELKEDIIYLKSMIDEIEKQSRENGTYAAKLEEQLKAADAREQSIIEAIEEEISALDGVYKAPYIEGVQAGYTDSIEIIKNQPKQ